jgi:WD40 repeat protein
VKIRLSIVVALASIGGGCAEDAGVKNDRLLRVFETGEPVRHVEASPDGTRLLANTVLLDASSGKELRRFGGLARGHGLWSTFSSDGKAVLSLGKQCGWDAALVEELDGKFRRHGGTNGSVTAVAFVPSSSRAFVGESMDGSWRSPSGGPWLWSCSGAPHDFSLPQRNLEPESKTAVIAVAVSPDGSSGIAIDASGTATLYNLDVGERARAFFPSSSRAVAFSRDGASALFVQETGRCRRGLIGAHVVRCNLAQGSGADFVASLPSRRPDSKGPAPVFSHDRRLLAYSTDQLHLIDIERNTTVDVISSRDPITAVAFGPDDRTLLVGTEHGKILTFGIEVDHGTPSSRP